MHIALHLAELAEQCALERANSTEPSAVMTKYFVIAYRCGVQDGIRQAGESLDSKEWPNGGCGTLALQKGEQDWSESREKS